MRASPVDLIGGFYQDDSLPWACQDTVNWIPEAAEAQGTRTPSILRDAPGLRPKVQVGTGPIRGMRNVEGKLLVVSGTQLYQISNDLVAIPRGNIPGTGRVSMAHNSRSGGNQVVIVNGAAGYVYDTNALTLTRITDAGYPGAFVVDFVDGYMAQIEPLRRYWFHSELTQALDYNTLDRYPAEGQPDALVTLLVDHREVWVFGERTIEPFVNTGALTNTFARASNTVIENGCSAKFSPAKLDNSIFWLDDLGIVRRAQGYTATRVSTSAIESAIADLDWSRAFGYTVTEKGHAIYYLTFPDGYTFGYDITTGLWHRRASYGLDRWRVNAVAYWNGAYICGDFQQGLLYGLDWDYPYDGDLPHVRRRVTGVTHDNQNRVKVPYAELIADNGRELVVSDSAPPQPAAPSITGDAPSGAIGDAYSYAYTPTGGEAPLVVSLWAGTLPPGLTLASSGILSGTPTTEGSYSWTVRVTDAEGLYDDLDDGAAITATAWFAGPVLVAADPAYYRKAGSPAGLIAATPTALPAQGSGVLQRISVANGKVFFHRAATACVSSDQGATWTACDNSLWGSSWARDVFWNGTKYYYGGVTSTDGITWTAIPNLPSSGLVQLARVSDGLILVQDNAGVTYTSVNNGTSWTTRSDIGTTYTDPFATNGDRILFNSSGLFGYFSDDEMATVSSAFNNPSFGTHYANGVWLKYSAFNEAGGVGIGLIRSTTGNTWPANAMVNYALGIDGVDLATSVIGTDGTNWAACETTGGAITTVYASADLGATWSVAGTISGSVTSFAVLT